MPAPTLTDTNTLSVYNTKRARQTHTYVNTCHTNTHTSTCVDKHTQVQAHCQQRWVTHYLASYTFTHSEQVTSQLEFDTEWEGSPQPSYTPNPGSSTTIPTAEVKKAPVSDSRHSLPINEVKHIREAGALLPTENRG